MKTSTFIRNAVHKHLIYTPEQETKVKTEFLCICFRFYYLDSKEALWDNWNKVHRFIKEELGHKTINALLPYITGEERQNIRRMYAEFIALHFEEQGD